MTEEEVRKETLDHIKKVQEIMLKIITSLYEKAFKHDRSKFDKEEFPLFIEFTPKLKDCTYGSEEYKKFLKELKPALVHHYSKNRHHPEHFKNGIRDMNLCDIIEMFCDWLAATKRHNDDAPIA